jgi:hypothetical protein
VLDPDLVLGHARADLTIDGRPRATIATRSRRRA